MGRSSSAARPHCHHCHVVFAASVAFGPWNEILFLSPGSCFKWRVLYLTRWVAQCLCTCSCMTIYVCVQKPTFKMPSGVTVNIGVGMTRSWTQIKADLPCSSTADYCVLGQCVNYLKFYKCTLDQQVTLMPEFIPWAQFGFS